MSDLGDGDVSRRRLALLRYWFGERTHWVRCVFGEPVPLDAPCSDLDCVALVVDVRSDVARRDQDRALLQAQRGQRAAAT